MTIKTYSAFTYGHTITDDNKYIQFNEGSGEQTATLTIGSYTLGSFVNEIATAMNKVAGIANEYSSSIDRTTREITISATGAFDLLISTGTLVGSDAFSLIGFNGSDLTGLSIYTGDSASGDYFEPQLYLQSYVPFENNKKTTQSTVNQSASGSVEVVSYGRVRFMECNINPQTNITQTSGSDIKNDPSGEDNLRSFLDYTTLKAPIEFVPDVDNPDLNLVDCILESTRASRDGVDYKLKEHYDKGYAEWFESGLLTFRELV